MAKTRANIETNVRYKLDTSATGGTWEDAELDAFIYDAMTTMWPLLPDNVFNKNAGTSTTYSPQATPADGVLACERVAADMRVLSLQHYVGSTATYRGVVIKPNLNALYHEMGLSNNWTSGISTTYAAVEGAYIYVGPYLSGDSVTERYIKWPTEFSADSSTLEDAGLADNYAPRIEDYAVYLALRQIGSPKAEQVLRDWKNSMATIWQSFSEAPLPAYLDASPKK